MSADGSVIDENIEATVLLLHIFKHRRDSKLIRHIGQLQKDSATELPNFTCDSLQFRAGFSCVYDDISPPVWRG